MAKSDIFNPLTFFLKTAQYASQGRGIFTIDIPPAIRDSAAAAVTTTNATFASGVGGYQHVETAGELLREGLVAKSVSSPGSSLATFEEFSYIGPTRKQPHTQIFGPLGVEFYLMGRTLEEAQSLYKTFLVWHEYIAGVRSSDIDTGLRSDSSFFAIEYYDRYITTADYKVYAPWDASNTESPTPIIHNKYYEIYPRSVGQISTAWDSQDTPLTLSVEFEFYYMQSRI